MRFYAWMLDEHRDEFDRVEETDENPLGLIPNAKATPESIRDYFNYTVIVTNHKPMSCDEIEEGLSTDPVRLSARMVEEFEKSECYKHKTEEERKEIIEFLKEEPMEQNPFIHI